MAKILWTSYQRQHITERHQITRKEFEEAWRDRDPRSPLLDRENGEYYEEIGFTDSDRCLKLIWRWQDQDKSAGLVWPITAFDLEDE